VELQLLLSPLWRVWPGFEQCNGTLQVRNCLLVCMPLERRLCGLLEVWQRPRVIAPAFEVHGQLGGQLCTAIGIAPLQPFPNVPVEQHPLGDA
jgi:hypothetical protein